MNQTFKEFKEEVINNVIISQEQLKQENNTHINSEQIAIYAPKGITENGAIQFLIRASISKDNSSFLRAGYSANADIILSKKDKVMAISESVLQFDKEKPFVEVEKGNQVFEKRFVKTGLSDGINIEILEGIQKTDKLKMPQLAEEPKE